MDIRPIRTEEDYRAALKMVSPYFDNEPAPGSADEDRFEILVTLIEAYEAQHHPIAPPDPIEAIKFRMEQQGLTAKDLVPMIGRLNRVYEVLSRARPLTLSMIYRLHTDLGIPLESLVQPAAAKKKKQEGAALPSAASALFLPTSGTV
ncbi:helix-turn-helix domain-containing protein [Amantichitinum ursilacus]|uniref:Antitoxin HigA n=1 Tax=Amantichitinum ursilacus TaxID=857265 RepID=A0A0N1JRQ1_9NEIS|nr:transcriptional regulator [Amantichitinum ursilacus]KPC49658.1 Antitoxin HigA [Amantichitinum ursilacus]